MWLHGELTGQITTIFQTRSWQRLRGNWTSPTKRKGKLLLRPDQITRICQPAKMRSWKTISAAMNLTPAPSLSAATQYQIWAQEIVRSMRLICTSQQNISLQCRTGIADCTKIDGTLFTQRCRCHLTSGDFAYFGVCQYPQRTAKSWAEHYRRKEKSEESRFDNICLNASIRFDKASQEDTARKRLFDYVAVRSS